MFEFIENISLESLKLCLIFNQTEIYIYNASKDVAEYLRPLSKKKNSMTETKGISVQETIDHIMQRIYARKAIKILCKNSIFKTWLLKLTKECVSSVDNLLIKQIDEYPVGGLIFVVFLRYFWL